MEIRRLEKMSHDKKVEYAKRSKPIDFLQNEIVDESRFAHNQNSAFVLGNGLSRSSIEPQELNLPTFNRTEKKIVNNNKLWFEKLGLPTVQDTLFDGFKLKSETSLKETVIIPVKNGNYPCYVHSYPSDTVEGPRAPAVKLTARHSSLTRTRVRAAPLSKI